MIWVQFFTTEPFACEPTSLPKYPPSKEMDVKLRDAESRRLNFYSFSCLLFSGFVLHILTDNINCPQAKRSKWKT